MNEDKYRAALDAAAKQLSCRALSAKMLRGKLLAKGHDEEAADYYREMEHRFRKKK